MGIGARIGLALALLAASTAVAAARRAPSHHTLAAHAEGAVYADERECIDKKALEDDECHNAALNSHAEYEEKAPHFDNGQSCAQIFGGRACAMRIGFGSGGIAYLPAYRGFTLGRDKGETTVLPVVSGAPGLVEFASRPVSHLDTAQDPARASRAQLAWQRQHAPTPRAVGSPRYREVPRGVAPDLGQDDAPAKSGPAATYPVNPAMLKRMQDEMRKYGTPPSN